MEARNWENNFENVGLEVLFFSSGLTIPAEIIVLKASSTEISKSLTEDSGTKVYQPVVGFGAVGMKTLNNFSFNSGCKEGQHHQLQSLRYKDPLEDIQLKRLF